MGVLSLSKNSISAINKRTRRNGKKNIDSIVRVGIGHNRHCISWRWDWTVHIRGRKKRSTCTKLVPATVVDMQRESVGVGDSSASGEVRLKSWFPVYEYTVDGAKQRVKALIGTTQPERTVGETVELFVNPDRANEFYCPTEKRLWIQNVFIVVGGCASA